jgi:BlaI family transcriptional regulator, penicillinase repressor
MSSKKDFKPLTKAEEAVMQALWQYEAAFIKDVIAAMPAPQPHYNTVSTLLKILVEKEYVSSELMGNAHRYSAAISKDDYSRKSVKQLLKGYFNNSFADMVSFFAADKELEISELEAILKKMKKNQN